MPAEVTVSSIIEASLFIGGPPITIERLQQVLRGVEASIIADSVAQLNQLYQQQNRPYEIHLVENGYEIRLHPSFRKIALSVNRHGRSVRLSQAAIEVLSIIAYRQPVTSQEVEALRGADCRGILRQLRQRDLISVVDSTAKENSRLTQYGTTGRFLELFHLTNLDELPRVRDLELSEGGF